MAHQLISNKMARWNPEKKERYKKIKDFFDELEKNKSKGTPIARAARAEKQIMNNSKTKPAKKPVRPGKPAAPTKLPIAAPPMSSPPKRKKPTAGQIAYSGISGVKGLIHQALLGSMKKIHEFASNPGSFFKNPAKFLVPHKSSPFHPTHPLNPFNAMVNIAEGRKPYSAFREPAAETAQVLPAKPLTTQKPKDKRRLITGLR